MRIGDWYRDFPLRPSCCRNPLVSRSRQVMSPVLGRFYGRQCFRLGEMQKNYRSRFSGLLLGRWRKEACLRSRVLRRRVILFVTAVRCFLNVQFLSSLDISAQLFVTLDVCAIVDTLTAFKTRDVFAQLLLRMMSAQLMSLTTSTSIDTIARKVQSNSRNMPDDNELRAFFAMSEAILNKEELRFQWSKRTLLRQKNMDAYWRYSVIVHFISGGTWIVCNSSLRAPMMFLFRWAKWTTASTGSSFPVWQFEFPSRLFFQPVNWAQCCTTFLLKKGWVQGSVRQKFPSHRAYIFHSIFAMLW